MGTSGSRRVIVRFSFALAAVLGLALTPGAAFAQHGGGGGGHSTSGGGGSHSGGGSSSGAHPSSGGGYHGGSSAGAYRGEGRSYGGYSGYGASRGMTGRSGSSAAGRSLGSEGSRASNIRPAIADGQWHSFGNAGGMARSVGTPGFGGVRGANLGWTGGFRGGWGGGRWGGGGWGFGVWPYWGPYWAFGWNPWLYNPYWYSPYWYGPSSYYDYSDYSYDWSDDPPPYRPDSYNSQDAPDANLSPNYHLDSSSNDNRNNEDRQLDLSDTSAGDSNSAQNAPPQEPEAAMAPSPQP